MKHYPQAKTQKRSDNGQDSVFSEYISRDFFIMETERFECGKLFSALIDVYIGEVKEHDNRKGACGKNKYDHNIIDTRHQVVK